MQQELRRLAHGSHEQEQANRGQHVKFPAEEHERLAHLIRSGGKNRVELDRAKYVENGEDTEGEAEIAYAVDDEGLDRRRICFRFLIPETDQQIRHKPHAFPAEEELQEIV